MKHSFSISLLILAVLSNINAQELTGNPINLSNGWDNVLVSTDNTKYPAAPRVYQLIGTYQGWDDEAIYIAGYHYFNTGGSVSTKRIYIGNLAVNLQSNNIGIGTHTPSAKLEVAGTAMMSGNEANLDKVIPGNDLNQLANSGKMIVGWNRSAGAGETDFISNQGAGGNGGFAFYNHDNANAESQLVRILGNGDVGIGTAAPAEKLSVNGKIRAKEIKVETSNWPDYVFTKAHQLPSLTEVEKYIKANKHLPEIPSAKEAEADGISLGEMNTQLLKKIEEITLYLIEQNKEIKELKASNEELKKAFLIKAAADH